MPRPIAESCCICSAPSAQQSEAGPWKPAYIGTLEPLTCYNFPNPGSMIMFSWDLLQRILHGAVEHSPGLYYVPKSAGGSVLSNRTFYAIDATNEPYIPSAPCDHGATVTDFFNENSPEDGGNTSYKDVSLFVSASTWGDRIRRSNEYIYFGTYSQTRWSDKISYDDIATQCPAARQRILGCAAE
jgi:hypothetical protein